MKITLILLIFWTVLCLCSLVLAVRNSWVFKRQTELNRHENGVHVIRGYADYNTMIRKFWIWDVEKFKLPNNKTEKE